MSRRIVGVGPRDTLQRAGDLMDKYEVRHLPVLRGARLVGILSDRDLRTPRPSAKLVQDIMTLNPVSIAPDASVDEAACVMRAHKFSALTVVEKRQLMGILTTTDVLRAFVDLSGAAERTTRLIVSVRGSRSHPENEVRRIVRASHGELKWLHRQGARLHLRLKGSGVDDIVTALEAAGFEVTTMVASQAAHPDWRRQTTPRRREHKR